MKNNKSTITWPCRKCGKGPFISQAARNMHEMRVHTSAGQMGARWKTKTLKKLSREEVLAKKRAYNKKYRRRMQSLGLTTIGKPRVRKLFKRFKPIVFDATQTEPSKKAISYCPHCGENIARFLE